MQDKPSILVTGCSSGIGRYCAGRLREDGFRVFATARKDADLAALRSDGFEAHYLDYRESDSVCAAFDAVVEATGGRLDALYNNGAYSQAGAVEDLPTDALREQFEANLFGWHELARLAVPVMRAQGGGRIVHASSVLGLVPAPLRGAYVASKFALEGLVASQRMELYGSGVDVSLLEIGPVPSKIALNAIPYVHKYIDVDGSVHAALYRRRLAQLEAGGTADDGGRALEQVYSALNRALTARNPKTHYLVTPNTRIAAFGKWLLPADLFYRLVAKRT
ncbi:SDR family NAD(P)-dependent oxidoreductase [Oricola sp.]|uniref:SDR family NAD(P)-dependent oxidoreductase n=1 Tax=Oricola sp. TaxID=1979950 RepID=UPI003BA9B09E